MDNMHTRDSYNACRMHAIVTQVEYKRCLQPMTHELGLNFCQQLSSCGCSCLVMHLEVRQAAQLPLHHRHRHRWLRWSSSVLPRGWVANSWCCLGTCQQIPSEERKCFAQVARMWLTCTGTEGEGKTVKKLNGNVVFKKEKSVT
jgi:hypothetical protein